MTLADIIAADESAVFLNQNDFAEAVEIYPDEGTVHFSAVGLFGDTPVNLATGEGIIATTETHLLLLTATIQPGMLAQTGTARNLRRGDAIKVTAGQNAGTWIVVEATLTDGDNADATVRRERNEAMVGQNREARP